MAKNPTTSSVKKALAKAGATSSQIKAVTSAMSKGSSGASAGRIEDNPLVFDTPAYNNQFGGLKGDKQSKAISSYSKSNPNMQSQATDFLDNPTIGVNDLQSFPKSPTLPERTINEDYMPDIVAGNVGAGLNADGTVIPQQVAPVQTAEQKILAEYGIAPVKPPSMEDAYLDAQDDLRIQEKEQRVNDLSAQIGALNAQAQAQQLSLEGQGRGQTTQFLGGEQARISREAAIAVMPLQAQLQAAQDNLELANKTLDRWYQIKATDIQNEYQYKTSLFNAVVSIADKKQAAKLAEMTQEANFKHDKEMAYLNDELATKRAMLGGSSVPTVKTINGVDMQWNASTGAWETPSGATVMGDTSKVLDQTKFLRDTVKEAITLADKSGKGIFDRIGGFFKGDTKYNQYETITDTLKTNILTLAGDPAIRKFFGPQMSERDVQMMLSSGSVLNAQTNSPTQAKAELKRIDDILNKIQTATRTGVTSQNLITAPTGELIQIID